MNEELKELEPFGYPFGTPARLGGDFDRVLPSILATFSSQRELWNQLCEIEADNRKRYREIVESGTEEAAVAQAAVQKLQEQIAAAAALPAKQRDREKIAAWRSDLKSAKSAAKIARAASAALQTPALTTLEVERRTAVKAAVAAAGLWWCHSEVVIERYDVARVRAMKTNSVLRTSHVGDVFGMLRVRWQNGLPLHVLTNGGDTLARLTYQRRGAGAGQELYELRLCIESDGREKDYVMIPIVISRHIPEGSMVRNIVLSQRRTGDCIRWHGAICVQQPALEPPRPHTDAWRILKQADLVDDDYYLKAMAHVSWLQSVLDKKANEFVATCSNLDVMMRIESLQESRERRMIVYSDLRRIAREIADDDLKALLDHNLRMWREHHNLRAHAVRHRDYRYRQLACDLARTHARLEVEKPMMAFDRKRPDRPAWGRFCQFLQQAGRRHGCDVVFFVPEKHNDDMDQAVVE